MLIDNSSLPGIFPWTVMPSSAWLTLSVRTALRCVLNGTRSQPVARGLSHVRTSSTTVTLTEKHVLLQLRKQHFLLTCKKLFREKQEGDLASGCTQYGLSTSSIALTWNSLESQNLGPTSELANQILRFNKSLE